MDYSKQNISNYYLYDTQVENLFLSEYMASAPGEYVKAYLLASMYAQLNMPSDDRIIAQAVGMAPEKMVECWAYWEKLGVVRRIFDEPGDETHVRVEFVNLREEVFGSREPSAKKSAAARLSDKELARLYRNVEAAAGRMLEATEGDELASWLTEYAMSPEFILCGYKFCAAKRKSTRARYVGTVLKDWKSKGLSSPAQVEEYLHSIDLHYDLQRKIFRELGFTRGATEEEKRIMNKWFDEYGFDLEKIRQACSKTAGIANPNINYVDAILTDWYRESGKKPEDGKALLTTRVEALYEQDRQQNAQKSEQIRTEVFTKIPQMRRIIDELRACNFEASRFQLMGESGKEAVARTRRKIKTLREERNRLLEEAGYPPTALEPIYTCKQCRDTGMLDDDTRCGCYKEKVRLLTE